MVLIRLENPFEKILKQRVQNAVAKTVAPILNRLDALEMKVAAYERNVGELPTTEGGNSGATGGGDDELARELDIFRRSVAEDPVDSCVLGEEQFKDDCLIIPSSLEEDYSLEGQHMEGNQGCDDRRVAVKKDASKQQLIVRVTSWTCHSVFVPEDFDYHVDLTKRTLDLLIEQEPTVVLVPEKKKRSRKISRTKI